MESIEEWNAIIKTAIKTIISKMHRTIKPFIYMACLFGKKETIAAFFPWYQINGKKYSLKSQVVLR